MAIDDEECPLAKTSKWSCQCNAHALNNNVALRNASPCSMRAIQMIDVSHTKQLGNVRFARAVASPVEGLVWQIHEKGRMNSVSASCTHMMVAVLSSKSLWMALFTLLSRRLPP